MSWSCDSSWMPVGTVEVVVAPHVVDHLQERRDEAQRNKTGAKTSNTRGVRLRQPFLPLEVISFIIFRVLKSTVAGSRPCPDLQPTQQTLA